MRAKSITNNTSIRKLSTV